MESIALTNPAGRLYPVDMTRANEFGYAYAEAEEEKTEVAKEGGDDGEGSSEVRGEDLDEAETSFSRLDCIVRITAQPGLRFCT